MRSRRSAQVEMAAISRRRLELLSAELAGLRSLPGQGGAAPSAAESAGQGGLGPGPERSAEQTVGQTAERTVEQRARAALLPEDDPPDVQDGGTGRELDVPSTESWAIRRPPPVRGRHARRPVGPAQRIGGWVHDRLPPTLQGRVWLAPAHLTVVALLVAAALAVTSWWVVRTDGSTTVLPAATWSDSGDEAAEKTGEQAGGAASALVTPAVAAAPGPSQPAIVVVDVAGKVRKPGIATLPLGSRVVDALEAAGGVRRGVDLATLNLARVLVDGEQIVVGIPPPGGVAAPAASVPGAAGAGGQLVNINTADQTELEELPGVGPVTAAAILQWRSDHGPFTSVDELMEVSGIGEATLAEMAPFVTL